MAPTSFAKENPMFGLSPYCVLVAVTFSVLLFIFACIIFALANKLHNYAVVAPYKSDGGIKWVVRRDFDDTYWSEEEGKCVDHIEQATHFSHAYAIKVVRALGFNRTYEEKS